MDGIRIKCMADVPALQKTAHMWIVNTPVKLNETANSLLSLDVRRTEVSGVPTNAIQYISNRARQPHVRLWDTHIRYFYSLLSWIVNICMYVKCVCVFTINYNQAISLLACAVVVVATATLMRFDKCQRGKDTKCISDFLWPGTQGENMQSRSHGLLVPTISNSPWCRRKIYANYSISREIYI